MTPEDVVRTMRLLSAAWSYFPHDDDVSALWTAELGQLDAGPAQRAAKFCAETMDDLPRLAAFLRLVAHEARMDRLATHVALPMTPPCGLCDDTGWAKAANAGAVDAVIRCRCSKGQVPDGHAPSCSCMSCLYGERRADDIARGRDGLSRRTDVDPLAQPVSGRQTWGE